MPRNTGPDKPTRALVKLRDNYTCQWKGHYIGDDGQIQHRRSRNSGGSRNSDTNLPGNLVYLCPEHHAFIEANPLIAKRAGFRVPQGTDPLKVPMDSYERGHIFLDHDGGFTDADPDQVQCWEDSCEWERRHKGSLGVATYARPTA